jgi:hypothetical protein
METPASDFTDSINTAMLTSGNNTVELSVLKDGLKLSVDPSRYRPPANTHFPGEYRTHIQYGVG